MAIILIMLAVQMFLDGVGLRNYSRNEPSEQVEISGLNHKIWVKLKPSW